MLDGQTKNIGSVFLNDKIRNLDFGLILAYKLFIHNRYRVKLGKGIRVHIFMIFFSG